MIIEDHINFSGSNPLFGEPTDRRFVGLTNAYDAKMRSELQRAASQTGVDVKKGVYMWFSGPSFETPAEIRMARMMGADALACQPFGSDPCPLPRDEGCCLFGHHQLCGGHDRQELSHQETKDVAPLGGKRLAR